jgi:hypothetical protein
MKRVPGRRQFLTVLGRGLMVACVGGQAAAELGLICRGSTAWAGSG